MARRVLVTGAAGQLGSVIVGALRPDCEVVPLARPDLDITDHRAVMDRVSAARPDAIVNCAAYNRVDQAEQDAVSALQVNAFAVRSLAQAAAAVGATLVHYSTDFVFDGTAERPYREDDPPNPGSVYAASKLLGEWFALEAPGAYVLRVESLFGGVTSHELGRPDGRRDHRRARGARVHGPDGLAELRRGRGGRHQGAARPASRTRPVSLREHGLLHVARTRPRDRAAARLRGHGPPGAGPGGRRAAAGGAAPVCRAVERQARGHRADAHLAGRARPVSPLPKALTGCLTSGSRLRFLAVYGAALVALLWLWPPQVVGDGQEYLVTAQRFARLETPALDTGTAQQLGLTDQSLVGPDGRQDVAHFWFFPLLAAPFVRVSRLAGWTEPAGLVALNAGLLLAAAWCASRRLAWPGLLLLFGSPIVWWTNKVHVEPFTFSLLTMAVSLAREAPAASQILLGVAATQNPPIAALIPIVAACSWPSHRRRRVLAISSAAGLALAALHPAYYWLRLGRLTALVSGEEVRLPGLQALGATIWDPNVGLLVNDPALPLAVLILALGTRRFLRSMQWDAWLSVGAAAVFLVAFGQTENLQPRGHAEHEPLRPVDDPAGGAVARRGRTGRDGQAMDRAARGGRVGVGRDLVRRLLPSLQARALPGAQPPGAPSCGSGIRA